MAKFQPGQGKIGGRQKGTPNKKTVRFAEALTEKGFNIIDEFTSLYDESDNEGKRYLLCKAMEYAFPKPKAFEVEDEEKEEKQTIEQVITELNQGREK